MDKNALPVNQFQLKSCKPEDAQALYSWFTGFDSISRWGGPSFNYPMTPGEFQQALGVERLPSYWLKDEIGNIVGFGQFYVRLHRHHLGRLVIHPEHRGQGLGKLLVEKLLEKAPKEQVAEGASLFVYSDNLAAISCYQSLGFTTHQYPDEIPGNLANVEYMIKP